MWNRFTAQLIFPFNLRSNRCAYISVWLPVSQIDLLRKQVDELRQLQDAGSVDAALRRLRELLTRPPSLFYSYAAMAALENLVDVAREKNADQASRYAIILRQTRPLLYSPSLQALLLKLVGSKEEVAISKEIQKALKSPSTALPRRGEARYNAPPSPYSRRSTPSCYFCGRRGHLFKDCFARRGRGRRRGYGRGF